MLDLIKLDKELRHYKAQLAGKLGRLRLMLDCRCGSTTCWYATFDVYRISSEMGHIGLRYLALKERIEEAAKEN